MMNYIAHHGIKGQKWGVRRYQNEDGSLTPAGRERYYEESYPENEYRGFGTGSLVRGYAGNSSVGKIIARSAVIDVLAYSGQKLVSNRLREIGKEGLATFADIIGTGIIAANSALGITAAVQRGRNRI